MKKKIIITLLTATLISVCSVPCLAQDAFSYADLENYMFAFSSGVGAWGTTLTIDENGIFKGSYHDSDMGVTGEGYPNGTIYYCSFEGAFDKLEYVDDYTYVTEIRRIKYENLPETEEIIDGIRYVYSEPYGLDGAEDIYFYMPGADLESLPDGYLDWIRYTALAENASSLPFYGLYNEAMEEGFSSYDTTEFDDWEEELSEIDIELAEIEIQAEKVEKKLQNGNATQRDLNMAAKELYDVWDVEINDMWGRLKEMLDAETMAALTKEEINWINYKEAAAEEAGKEYEGGSMQPMVESMKAAELTRIRVYELAEYFR